MQNQKKKSHRKLNSSRRRVDNTHYDYIFEHNVNFKERVIYINDEISEFSLELILKAFDELEQGDGQNKPIRIEISSYGGSVYDMLGIVDRIRSSDCHVITRGFGYIMSAATWILAAGDERIMGEYSWMMVHELSDMLGRQKLTDLKHDLKHDEDIQDRLYQLYADLSSTNTKKSTFKKLCQKDHYMPAKDALKYGLIDKILGKDDDE